MKRSNTGLRRGWLEATRRKVSLTKLRQKCSKNACEFISISCRSVMSAEPPSAGSFANNCYVPKHTDGEQLLKVREAKREQAAFDPSLEEQGQEPESI